MKLGSLDLGGRPVVIVPHGGQRVSSADIGTGQSIPVSEGGTVQVVDVDFWIEAWQGLGGQLARSLAALRLLAGQVEELRQNRDMQPVLLQPFATDQTGAIYPSRSDRWDGWYYISSLDIDRESFVSSAGAYQAHATLVRVAPMLPLNLKVAYEGSPLSSVFFLASSTNLVGLPMGATAPATALSRTGAEGTIPLSAVPLGTPNTVPFVASSTVANLWLGGVRCYDTIDTTANPVPTTGGTFVNANWLQVYDSGHALTGDLVITNGLLLLLFAQGATGCPKVWFWNTQGTPNWTLWAELQYKDSSFTVGNIRTLTLERVSLRSSRVRVMLQNSNANFATFAVDLDAGAEFAPFDFRPDTEANSVAYGADLILTTAYKIVANEQVAYDVNVGSANLSPASTLMGWSVVLGTTSNMPIGGFLWQDRTDTGMPAAGSTTDIGFGRAAGPGRGSTETFAIWVAPWPNVPNHLAEAESGTLDAGWSVVNPDGTGASNNQSALCANATVTARAATWGSAFVPVAGVYDLYVRLKLGSLASGTSQMKIGLYNSTDSVFVASTTYAPNAAALAGGTSYIWVKVASGVTPPATKNLRVRAETTATTTTTWNMDESALVPAHSTVFGMGAFPADQWLQFAGRRRLRMVPG